MPESGALLAIDYGTRKVGLAIGHRLTASARPLEPIRYRHPEALFDGLAAVCRQWQPERVIVGLPLGGAGEETQMSRDIRKFANELGQRIPTVSIEMHDERMSSQHAAAGFALRRSEGRARRRDAGRLDSMAAAVILESWMSQHGIA
ncbi:MAG: Holliday junction resolvase RuvX [Wenzhouxiangella sp.]|jgi:putative Holliday junction resolvase|nr:Holliday junction resolvase RuvX [Wenzhouxiangella sp.]